MPLMNLLVMYRCETERIEKIPSYTRNPLHLSKIPFTISIADNKASSVKEIKNTREKIQVYMDGSAINGMVGAAAILIRANRPMHTLQVQLGPESKHMVHEAELVRIMLGM